MNFSTLKYVYFIGIGGIGMSALARYFKSLGCMVAGYDKTETTLTKQLIAEGIFVQFDESVEALPDFITTAAGDSLLIVYTPAIPATHAGFQFLSNKFAIYKRSQVLGFITKNSNTIAVAGTHGKTTTSSILAHLLVSNGFNCSAFLGGISSNYNTNFIRGNASKSNHIVVVEADEFDRSFLTLYPKTAIVTSMDADHLDIYDNHQTLVACYQQFLNQVNSDGCIIAKKGLPLQQTQSKQISYSIDVNAQAMALNIRILQSNYYFDYQFGDVAFKSLQLGLPGRHNIENAVAAITAGLQYGLNEQHIREALQSYKGVKRRFEKIVANSKVQFIDDYAHHPEELRATILSAKELNPDKNTTVVFQPHLFSRTRDFANAFSDVLSLADQVILLPIYPARELPISGVTSQILADKITTEVTLCNKDALIDVLKTMHIEVLLTLGAGDIDQLVNPISDFLIQRYG